MRKYIAFVLVAVSSVAWAQEQSVAAPKLLRAQDLQIEVESADLQRQYDALLGMSLQQIEYSPRGPIHNIVGVTGIVLPADANERKEGDSAADIFPLIKDMLLATGSETLRVERNSAVDPQLRALKLAQSLHGLPVINGGVSIGYSASTKVVSSVTANFVPDRGLPRTPKISAKQAEAIVPGVLAKAERLDGDVEIMEGTYLGYYAAFASPTAPELVWAVQASMPDGTYEMFYVDAITGAVVAREMLSQRVTRLVYNLTGLAPNTAFSSWPAAMTQPQINANSVALKADQNVEIADSRLLQRFPWASSDFPSVAKIGVYWGQANAQSDLVGTTNYLRFGGPNLPGKNAYSHPLDIVAHEFGHGIGRRTFGTSGDEASTLQEAYGDFSATVVDVAFLGSPASATWLLGEGLYTGSYASKGERSMKDPRGDPLLLVQSYYKDWFPTRTWPAGSGHQNSTILSHGYYLLVHGNYHARVSAAEIPDINVPAIDVTEASAEARAREVFFRAYRDPTMALDPTHKKMKDAATGWAMSLYGTPAKNATEKAFEAVGIGYGCTSKPSLAPDVNLEDLLCAGRFAANWPAMPGVNRYIAEIAPQVYG
jgi:hypothetical protein